MDYPHLVLARVYEHIEPIDRGERVVIRAGKPQLQPREVRIPMH